MIKMALGIREVDRFETYLGLPNLFGRSKYQTFSYQKDKVWKKKYNDGKGNYCLELVRKFSSKRWLNLFPLI